MIFREAHMSAIAFARLCRSGASCSDQEGGKRKENTRKLHLEGTRVETKTDRWTARWMGKKRWESGRILQAFVDY